MGNEPNHRGGLLYFERLDNGKDIAVKREFWDNIKFYKGANWVHGEVDKVLAALERWAESQKSRRIEREKIDSAQRAKERAQAEAAWDESQLKSLRSRSEWSLTREEQVFLLYEDIKVKLEHERNALQEFVAARRIKYLLHFTYSESLDSILQAGILSRQTMQVKYSQFTYSDEHRYDDLREASCLSVDFPNYLMLYKYRQVKPDICILAIDVSVLWELPCLFTTVNAARALHNHRPSTMGGYAGISAFEKLFIDRDNHRVIYDLPASFTTDPQAEVLVLNTIAPRYFRGIAFPRCVSEDRRNAVLTSQEALSLASFKDLSETPHRWFFKRQDDASRRSPALSIF